MVSEIERLHKENIALDAVVPYFKIAYVTKNKRKANSSDSASVRNSQRTLE